jgi:signal transduction histidine kinase
VLVSNLSAARVIEAPEGAPGRLALFAGAGEPVSEETSPLARSLAGQHVHERDLFAERLDGSLVPVEVHAEPILDNGRAMATVVVVRDQGEEQRVAAEMDALADAKSSAEVKAAEVARRLRTVEAELAEARESARQLEQSAEQARSEADARSGRFDRLVDGGGVIGVALFSSDEMRLVDCNEAALGMLGERRRARDVRGSALVEIAPGADASGMLDLFRKVAASGEPYSSEEYYVQGLRHGAAYWRFTLIPLISEPGRPAEELALLGVDVTASVEQRAAATAAPAAGGGSWTIEDVLLAISNDLRTPILSIQGMVGLFRQKYAEAVPDVTALHYLELTQRNADQIATLIDDLVELSSLGSEELKTAEIPLAAAIEEAWRANPRPGIELRVAGPLPTVRADRAKLMRALRDMFDTATGRKRDGAGAWVHVGVRDLGEQWEIELADNGHGVASAEEGERLFGPLARHLVTVPNNGGPTLIAGGLGLAAVRRIAELHGGAASVAPAPEGEGAVYTMTIEK